MAKVDVLTDKDVEFPSFFWWSKWIDICVFTNDITPYLIQMKVSRFNGKRFRHIRIKEVNPLISVRHSDVGDLVQMKGEG